MIGVSGKGMGAGLSALDRGRESGRIDGTPVRSADGFSLSCAPAAAAMILRRSAWRRPRRGRRSRPLGAIGGGNRARTRAYCDAYPSYSACTGTEAYCESYPTYSACTGTPAYCERNPSSSECRDSDPRDPCTIDRWSRECKMQQCKDNDSLSDRECHEVSCRYHPEQPSCNSRPRAYAPELILFPTR